jgi:2-keto-4-pentenoate hydratase/2-oxohepta-3-ene-1,7-dioic acid hydratase in catechol pathway
LVFAMMSGRAVDEWYAAPTFYFSNPHTLIGAHDDVAVPPGCALLDFELAVGRPSGFGR